MGLLEERERAARQRVEALEVELRVAQAVLERFVIAREIVGQVLAEPREPEEAPAAPSGVAPLEIAGAAPGAVVPVWRDGLDPTVLAPTYRQIMEVLAGQSPSGGQVMDCRQLAAVLGLEPVAAKVEGVRAKAKRLTARGWLVEESPGMFSVVAGRGGGS